MRLSLSDECSVGVRGAERVRNKGCHYRTNRDHARLALYSQAPSTSTDIAVEEHMDTVLVGRLLHIGAPFQRSVNLSGSIYNDVAIVTGQHKHLFVADIIDQDATDGVRIGRVNSIPTSARSWRVQYKLRLIRQALIGKAWLIDIKLIDRGKKIEIMLMREARQVATPISQIWRRDTIAELSWVSGNLGNSNIIGPADSEWELCSCVAL